MKYLCITLAFVMAESANAVDIWMMKKCIGFEGEPREELACIFDSVAAVEDIYSQAIELGIDPKKPWSHIEKGASHWARLVGIFYPPHFESEQYDKSKAFICLQGYGDRDLPWKCSVEEKLRLKSIKSNIPRVWLIGFNTEDDRALIQKLPNIVEQAVRHKIIGHYRLPLFSINYEASSRDMYLRYSSFGENCGTTHTIRIDGHQNLSIDWEDDRGDICI